MADRQDRLAGLPGPSPEEIQKAQALETSLEELHAILRKLARGLPENCKISTSLKRKGGTLCVTFAAKD